MAAPKPIAFAHVRLLAGAPAPCERARLPQGPRETGIRAMVRGRGAARPSRGRQPELDAAAQPATLAGAPGHDDVASSWPHGGPPVNAAALSAAEDSALPAGSCTGQGASAAAENAAEPLAPLSAIARSVSRAAAMRDLCNLVIAMCGTEEQRQAGPWEATLPLQRQGLGASHLHMRLSLDSLLLVFACDGTRARDLLASRLGDLQRQLLARLLPSLEVRVELEMA